MHHSFTRKTCNKRLSVLTDVDEVCGKWQKCVEDNAGVEVDVLKHGGAGSEEQTQVLNWRKEKFISRSRNTPSQDLVSAASSAPSLSSAFPAATRPSAASVPRVATATRAASPTGAGGGSSGPVAAVPLLVPLSVPAAVPLSIRVGSSSGRCAARCRAAFLLSTLEPLFLLLLALLLLLLLLLLVSSLALLLPLCAVQKPLRSLVDKSKVQFDKNMSQNVPLIEKKYKYKTNLLLSVGKPVYTWSCFGLEEQVVQQFGWRLVAFLCSLENTNG